MIQLQAHAFNKNLNLKFLWNKTLNKAYTDISGYSTGLLSLEKYLQIYEQKHRDFQWSFLPLSLHT